MFCKLVVHVLVKVIFTLIISHEAKYHLFTSSNIFSTFNHALAEKLVFIKNDDHLLSGKFSSQVKTFL
jgi:hypothetical protein